jgi:hypothetical protein
MTEEVKINVYLINKVDHDGPKDGSTLFVFDVPDKPPTGVDVDHAGNITFTAMAPAQVSFKYVLRTPKLSWAEKPYNVSFQPTSNQPNEHMLWVTSGTSKPTTSAPPAGFKNYLPHNDGTMDSMSVTIDRSQAKEPGYSYALAVNMADAGMTVTTVRDDPQIKNPPREFAIDWTLALGTGLGLVVGLVCGNLFAQKRMRKG